MPPPMGWLNAFYSRRIVNVNVNVVAAGICALGITVLVMHTLESTGLLARLQDFVPDFTFKRHGEHHKILGEKLAVSGTTFLVDLVADVLVYYGLHWLANHMPRKKPRPVPATDKSFMKDASIVQLQRAVLSPLLYLIALGFQNVLLHHGAGIARATTVGFVMGIAVSRVLHTLWMLASDRRAVLRRVDEPPLVQG